MISIFFFGKRSFNVLFYYPKEPKGLLSGKSLCLRYGLVAARQVACVSLAHSVRAASNGTL
jgi:hypothetical protein